MYLLSRVVKYLVKKTSNLEKLWKMINKLWYEGKTTQPYKLKSKVFRAVQENSRRFKQNIRPGEDVNILNYFNVTRRSLKTTTSVECTWIPPDLDELMICCDGAAEDNPGNAGIGVVARNHDCDVLGAVSMGLGMKSNYWAEVMAVVYGMEWAKKWGYRNLKVRSDSTAAIQAFMSKNIPWQIRSRWLAICDHYDRVVYEQVFREVNFSADGLAKRGAQLGDGVMHNYDSRPSFLQSVESPAEVYIRVRHV